MAKGQFGNRGEVNSRLPMRLLFFTTDLLFPSRVRAAALRLGYALDLISDRDELLRLTANGSPAVVCIDLDTPDVDIASLVGELHARATPPLAIIAYAAHVHEALLTAAKEAGCDEVLSRGKFHRQTEQVLARYSVQ